MVSADIKPIYVLYGSDEFLRDEYRRTIVERILDGADPQTAVSLFDATVELPVVLDELRTLPFLAPRRAVVIRDADIFVTAHRGSLEKYLQSPSSGSSLILLVSSWVKTTRLAKLTGKIGEAIDCSAPNGSRLIAWLGKAAGKRGKKVAPSAAELLIQWRGEDLAALSGELEKLSLYVGERQTITEDDVTELVVATTGPGAFSLTNAITAGETAAALKALAGSMTRRGEEFKMLGMIAWHLRRALAAAQQIDAGRRPDLRMPHHQKSAFVAMVKRRGIRNLQRDFRKLLTADLGMKTGADATMALQQLVVGLCN